MRKTLLILWLLAISPSFGQYYISGQLDPAEAGQAVYLSLVEDHRKTERPYFDQLIRKTQTDSLGHFEFRGDNLSLENRIYRLHVDECPDASAEQSHFLQNCAGYRAILFIANNRDTLSFPETFEGEVFCDIASTNPHSSDLLEVDLLKEAMAFEFSEVQSPASVRLNLERWFQRWQEYGESSEEPLTELFIYAFLSDRTSETRAFYLEDLENNPYYDMLGDRLASGYPETPYSRFYSLELMADKNLIAQTPPEAKYLIWVLGGLLLLSITLNLWLLFRKKGHQTSASPIRLKTLTAQERRIADHILENATNKEIASALFISLSTVKTHINSLYKKLGVESRAELKRMLEK